MHGPLVKLFMDDALATRNVMMWLLGVGSLLLSACTSKPDSKQPQEQVMHFPFSLALSADGETLAVNSGASDSGYDVGRLVTMATKSIKNALDGTAKKEPIDWDLVVKTNVHIPQDSGEISFTKSFMSFASRETSQLIAMPTASVVSCHGPHKPATDCPGAMSLVLNDYDPYALTSIQETPTHEALLVSHLSAPVIDMVNIDKAMATMKVAKTFNVLDWLKIKLPHRTFKHRRLITKKIGVSFRNDLTRSKAYFLLEEHPQRTEAATRAKASYLVAITVSDLVAQEPITDAKLELWNLDELFSIASAQDLYIDEVSNHAYVLARIPESLFKINLTTSELIDVGIVCTGAGSMAVSKDTNALVVPCMSDNRVAMYSLAPLRLTTVSAIVGRGPAMCAIDKAHNLIYCTYNNDGTLVIFDDTLTYRGYVFPKAPLNRMGS